MMFSKIIYVYFKNYAKPANTMSWGKCEVIIQVAHKNTP